jgi:hypothetical protein
MRRSREDEGRRRPYLSAPSSPSAPRRARSQVRRLLVQYRLSCFVTLTFAEPVTDDDHARVELRRFIRRLRRHSPTGLPWVAVIEAHESGRLHVHFATKAIPTSVIRGAWGLGQIDVQCMRTTTERRAVAAYMAKGFDSPRSRGQHRYERAEGMRVTAVRFTAPDEEGARQGASRYIGSEPSSVTSSSEWIGWDGPRVVVLWWDDEPRPLVPSQRRRGERWQRAA